MINNYRDLIWIMLILNLSYKVSSFSSRFWSNVDFVKNFKDK